MQVDAGQLSAEIASRGDEDLYLRGPDGLLVCKRVKEAGDATSRHGWTLNVLLKCRSGR
jgi:hypothetical protein